MDVRQRVGQNLKRLRQETSWSQEEFVLECGIHRTDISGLLSIWTRASTNWSIMSSKPSGAARSARAAQSSAVKPGLARVNARA
jgi:hypothetical protein